MYMPIYTVWTVSTMLCNIPHQHCLKHLDNILNASPDQDDLGSDNSQNAITIGWTHERTVDLVKSESSKKTGLAIQVHLHSHDTVKKEGNHCTDFSRADGGINRLHGVVNSRDKGRVKSAVAMCRGQCTLYIYTAHNCVTCLPPWRLFSTGSATSRA